MAKRYRVTGGTRLANAALGFLLRGGAGPKFMRLLTVAGRRTGQPRSTPVVPVQTDRGRWLVAPFGEVGWVRNARAAGQATLSRGRSSETLAVTEVEAREAIPVLREYLALKPAGRYVRACFDVEPDSSDEAFAADAPHHPVFELHPLRWPERLEPAGEVAPAAGLGHHTQASQALRPALRRVMTSPGLVGRGAGDGGSRASALISSASPADLLGPGAHGVARSGLGEDRLEMVLDRVLGEKHPLCDVAGVGPLRRDARAAPPAGR